MQGATGGAIVVIIAMCTSSDEYMQLVGEAIVEYGLELVDIEWCSNLNRHLEEEILEDAYVIDMIDAVQKAAVYGGIGFCQFHTWDSEQNSS